MSKRIERANKARAKRATRQARINWHQAMDNRFTAYTDPRRNDLVCFIGPYDAHKVFSEIPHSILKG